MRILFISLFLLLYIPIEVFSQMRIGVFYTPALNLTRFRSKKDHVVGDANRADFSYEVGLHVDVPFSRHHFSPTLSFISRRNSLSIMEEGMPRIKEIHKLQYVGLTFPLKLATEEYNVAGVMGTRFLFVVGPKLLLKVYHFPETKAAKELVRAFNVGDVAMHVMAGSEIPIGLETKAVVGFTYTAGLIELDRAGLYPRSDISLRNTAWGLSLGIIF